jgi:hypothetical protein
VLAQTERVTLTGAEVGIYNLVGTLKVEGGGGSDVVVEGAVVVETDLATAVVQMTASLEDPGKSRTVRVLRHDPDKVSAAIQALLRRGR